MKSCCSYHCMHGSVQQNEESMASTSKMPRPLSLSKSPVGVLRVAYQGLPGAFGESAAVQAYPNCEAMPCEQFEAAFEAVEVTNTAERIVLPLENSIGGSIHRNYDLLLRHSLHIIGEVQLPVRHCLLSMHGVTPHELVRVISHQQAFAQCEHTLAKMLGEHVAQKAVDNTAGAAQIVSAQALRDTAVIASARAAKLYGLQVMAEGIEDDESNVTRFVVLAREPLMPRSDCPFKTSIVVAHDESTRILFKVVAAFAFRRINLTKIESLPQRKRPLRLALLPRTHDKYQYFEYLFYIDFEASMAEPRAQNALAEIQEFVTFLRVLGSYPIDTTLLNITQRLHMG